MKEIELKLTLPELNQILEVLGMRPYAEVHNLIAKLHQQAAHQIDEEKESSKV